MAGNMDTCIQLRLHTLTKRQYLLVFFGFFAAFTLTVIIGAASPKVLASFTQYLGVEWSDTPSNITNSVDYAGKSPPGWTSFSQELWLKCTIETEETSADYEQLRFKLRVTSIQGQDGDAEPWKTLYQGIEILQHARDLKCKKTCKPFTVLHLGQVSHKRYDVQFSLEQISDRELISNMTFEWEYYSPEFTQLQVWSQFIFIILTFITAFQYMRALRAFSVKDWCLEQRWITFLLIMLVLFNNPLYPLHFLVAQAWGERFFEALFKTTFICSLLLFWLCTLHSVQEAPRKYLTFYLPKFFIVGLVWLAALTIMSWEEYNSLSDPAYQMHLDTGSFKAWKIVFYVAVGTYLFYLAYVSLRAYGAQSPIDIRLKFFASVLFIVVLVSCTVLIVRFGVETLEPSFVSSSSPRYRNAAEFLTLTSIFNYYIYTMAFVYSPSPNAVRDSELKSDSSFTRLYDADNDEEVMFTDPALDASDEYSVWK